MKYLIPFVSAFAYRMGGTDQWKWCFLNQKIWRMFIGIPISFLIWGHWVQMGLVILAYATIPFIFKYGEKSWLNFLGEYGKFFVSGLSFGACSFIVLPLWFAVSQTILSGISFLAIKWLDDKNIVKNPWVELLRGFMGTLFYLCKGTIF
jgi:hypothetical protein